MQIAQFLETVGEPVALQKGAHLFRQGEREDRLFFTTSGLLKAYYLTEDGRELVKSFFQEGNLVGSLVAATQSEPSPYGIVCLEPSALLRFDYAELNAAVETDLELARETIGFLMDLALKKERREYEFLCLSPEERYRALQGRSPNLLQRLTQNDIARYCGVTPVALSRIRRRIADRNR